MHSGRVGCKGISATGVAGFLLATALLAGFFTPASAETPQPWTTLPAVPELPAGGMTGHSDVEGARIWWIRYNSAATGRPVLLLHGGFGSSNYFAYLISALVADGRSVIAIDSRGHGRSSLGRGSLSYQRMASDVVAVLKDLQVSHVDLVGWSDGGIIGLELAIRHPTLINRLFAFGANVNPSGIRAGSENAPVFKAYLDRAESDYAKLSAQFEFPALQAQLLHMWSTQPHLPRALLHRIAAPVTIADGQYEEAILPEHVAYMAAAIPNANTVILPNVSHFAMLQQPENFNDAVLYFLRYR